MVYAELAAGAVQYMFVPFASEGTARPFFAANVETAILYFQRLFDINAEKSAAIEEMLRRRGGADFQAELETALVPNFVIARA